MPEHDLNILKEIRVLVTRVQHFIHEVDRRLNELNIHLSPEEEKQLGAKILKELGEK